MILLHRKVMFRPLFPPARRASAFQNPEEDGGADQRGDDAKGNLGRRGGGAGQRIGHNEEHRPACGRCGNQPTMVRADNPPRQVRHDQADEADHAANGDGGRSRDGDGDQQEEVQSPHVDAQIRSRPLSSKGDVHRRGHRRQPQ